MTKNRLEKLFSKSLEQFCWGIKLHNNPLAHQNTPADYIISEQGMVYLVECKQVTCKDGKGRLAFNRLKQMHDLLSFGVYSFHKAYFCIAFWDGRWSNSEVYLIPAIDMQAYIIDNSKVSANRVEFKKFFDEYRVYIVGGIIECKL